MGKGIGARCQTDRIETKIRNWSKEAPFLNCPLTAHLASCGMWTNSFPVEAQNIFLPLPCIPVPNIQLKVDLLSWNIHSRSWVSCFYTTVQSSLVCPLLVIFGVYS